MGHLTPGGPYENAPWLVPVLFPRIPFSRRKWQCAVIFHWNVPCADPKTLSIRWDVFLLDLSSEAKSVFNMAGRRRNQQSFSSDSATLASASSIPPTPMDDFQEQFPGLYDERNSPQFLFNLGYPAYIEGDISLAPMDLLNVNDFNINEPFSYSPTSPGSSLPHDQGSVSPTNLHIDTRRLTPNPSYDSGRSAIPTPTPSSAILTPDLGPMMGGNQLPEIHIHTSPQSVRNGLLVTSFPSGVTAVVCLARLARLTHWELCAGRPKQ
ncbi:hypothetical protein F5141DRAFT_740269 [Pisolithus sp. B1]|nr:hypothetical protein F5141DRAFT_740269 [Pisolithus sp. B1]